MVTLSGVYRCSVQIFIHFMLDIEYIIKGVMHNDIVRYAIGIVSV